MNVRLKKLIGMVAILAFLAAYIWAVVGAFAFVPPVWWAQVGYMAVFGMAWWLPLIPLIKWMNREN